MSEQRADAPAASTAAVYDREAGHWSRCLPMLVSDFTARPCVLQACEPLRGLNVLDLGCGEGYVARQLVERGAASVLGIDISHGMIEHARDSELLWPHGIEFRVGDAAGDLMLPDMAFDLAVAVFLFNYLDRQQMLRAMRTVRAALKPKGRFVFTVPHPLLPFFRAAEPPFYFHRGGAGYFDGRDQRFEGRLWRLDGVDVPVRCIHKTIADYFDALRAAGFERMPRLSELSVTEEHLRLDPAFFAPLREQPLHLMFEVDA